MRGDAASLSRSRRPTANSQHDHAAPPQLTADVVSTWPQRPVTLTSGSNGSGDFLLRDRPRVYRRARRITLTAAGALASRAGVRRFHQGRPDAAQRDGRSQRRKGRTRNSICRIGHCFRHASSWWPIASRPSRAASCAGCGVLYVRPGGGIEDSGNARSRANISQGQEATHHLAATDAKGKPTPGGDQPGRRSMRPSSLCPGRSDPAWSERPSLQPRGGSAHSPRLYHLPVDAWRGGGFGAARPGPVREDGARRRIADENDTSAELDRVPHARRSGLRSSLAGRSLAGGEQFPRQRAAGPHATAEEAARNIVRLGWLGLVLAVAGERGYAQTYGSILPARG